MKKSCLLLVFLLILITALSAFAQEQEANWRNFEVSVISGLSIPTGTLKTWNDSMGAKTGFPVGFSGGYYFNEKLCLGAYFTYTRYGMKLYDMHYIVHDGGLYLKYAFVGESNIEPYVKLSAGAAIVNFPTWIAPYAARLRELSYDPGLSLGVNAGLLYYTSDFGGLYVEGSYHYAAIKDHESTHKDIKYYLEDNLSYFDVRAGITVFFGPGQ
jgi:hypothetical protein